MTKQKLRRLTMAALCGAVSFVLMLFSFSVPILSPFANFDFSALPELIGGFILGPVGAIEIIVVKLLLKVLFQGSNSMLTGELINLILSVSYVLPALLYYRRHKTKKGAAIGLVIGTVVSVVVSIFANIYLTFPLYIKLYGMNWDSIIEICTAVNPWITNIPTMVAFSIVPFNLVSRAVTSFITFLVYKKLSVPIKKLIQ
jgi:riboflavin transporter FmnP